MEYTYERTFYNLKHTCLGQTYQFYDDALKDLLYGMRDKIGHPFIDKQHNLRFVMNLPLYHEFSIVCQMSGHDPDIYRGIKIIADPNLYIGNTSDGIVKLIYEEEAEKSMGSFYDDRLKTTAIGNRHHEYYLSEFKNKPHIDHVIFNNPATIVFWKDGTKTVVKHDGKGRKDKRQAILYAFIRKIYGEGKPYNNILNEIEEALK